jgi:hypothetical protein
MLTAPTRAPAPCDARASTLCPSSSATEWTSDEVQAARAEMRGVEWYVGKTLSEGFIALRRIPDDGEDDEGE